MKYFLMGLGVALILMSIVSLFQIFNNVPALNEYGQGVVFGKILMLLLGMGMVYWGWKRGKKMV
ncbi:MAG: hypothetical protein IT270_07480 [Saprospiraceae bacterium]|nr:hypothetical protein [Saprospiraceae bacterium]